MKSLLFGLSTEQWAFVIEFTSLKPVNPNQAIETLSVFAEMKQGWFDQRLIPEIPIVNISTVNAVGNLYQSAAKADLVEFVK